MSAAAEETVAAPPSRRLRLAIWLLTRSFSSMLGLFLVTVIVALALAGPWIVPYPEHVQGAIDLANKLQPPSAVFELEHEIERAIVVDPRRMPRDVVTMNSRARLRLDDEPMEVALVYPDEADDGAGRLSVCSGIGTAILGYREGDAFDWRVTHRTRHVRIEQVIYQPEAAGHFHL